MTEPIPNLLSTLGPKRYGSVMEMVRDLHADDPEFVASLEKRLQARQFVTALAVIRARAGMSPQGLAVALGWSQRKIDKIEFGVDADLKFGDVIAYLRATGHAAKIFVVPEVGSAYPVLVEPPVAEDQLASPVSGNGSQELTGAPTTVGADLGRSPSKPRS